MGNELSADFSGKEIEPVNHDSKLLPKDMTDSIVNSLKSATHALELKVLSQLLSLEEVGRSFLQAIDPETTYIARIPKKLQADMRSGLLDFMREKKSGENLGDLVDQNHRIRGKVRIEEGVKVDLTQLSLNIASLAIQQQLAEMTAVLDDVRSRVIAIQEGMDHELFGSIKGMRNQLLQMRNAHNPETQKQLATNAITILNDTRGKIEEAIVQAIRGMKEVPSSDGKLIVRILKEKDYLPGLVNSYDRIEELFAYYITASQLLGYAFAFLGEPGSFEEVFTPIGELLNNEGFEKLKASEIIYEMPVGEAWYKNPEHYLVKVKNEAKRIFVQEEDFIEVELSGKLLLEVANDGK